MVVLVSTDDVDVDEIRLIYVDLLYFLSWGTSMLEGSSRSLICWSITMGPAEELQPSFACFMVGILISLPKLTFANFSQPTTNVSKKAIHSDTTKVIDCVTVNRFC